MLSTLARRDGLEACRDAGLRSGRRRGLERASEALIR
jgi:hypothetical protein